MEFLINLTFYDVKWLVAFNYIPIRVYKNLYYLSIVTNIIQSILLIVYSFHHELNFQKVNFLIISLINLFLLMQFIVRLDEIYYNEFAFIHEATKINPKISIKPFEVIIRSRTFETLIGISNISLSFYKFIVALKYDFFYEVDDHYTGFAQIISYIVFELYQVITVYCLVYLLITGCIFIIVKFGFLYLSLNSIYLQVKVSYNLKRKNSIDKVENKSISTFVDIVQKLLDDNDEYVSIKAKKE